MIRSGGSLARISQPLSAKGAIYVLRWGVVIMLVAATGLWLQADSAWALGTFVPLKNRVRVGHYDPMTVTLRDGRVLIAGGTSSASKFGPIPSRAVDIFDPKRGALQTTGSLLVPRAGQLPILLADGKVLFIGGDITIDTTAEIYDSATGQSKMFDLPPEIPNVSSVAPLPNGRVLAFGGLKDVNGYPYEEVKTAATLDPVTGEATAVEDMPFLLRNTTPYPLPDGRVLILGDFRSEYPSSDIERAIIFDPRDGSFSTQTAPRIPRQLAASVVLEDGRILFSGGILVRNTGNDIRYLRSAEVYDPNTGLSSPTGSPQRRYEPNAVRLADGRVLIAGGYGPRKVGSKRTFSETLTSEIYDPETGRFTPNGDLYRPRVDSALVALSDGRALVAGGSWSADFDSWGLKTAEIFRPNGPTAEVKALSIAPKARTARIGKWFSFKVQIRNSGRGVARRVKVCTTLEVTYFQKLRCPTLANILPGQTRQATLKGVFGSPSEASGHPLVVGQMKRMEIYGYGQDVNVYSTVSVRIKGERRRSLSAPR